MPFDPAPNLDAMSYEELRDFLQHVGIGPRPVEAARRLFPDRPRGYLVATRKLRSYGWNKVSAVGCRVRGDVEMAKTYEAICDRIYRELPDYARFW